MIVIEALAGRLWKAVEVFGSSRFCVSHFYLPRDSGPNISAPGHSKNQL